MFLGLAIVALMFVVIALVIRGRDETIHARASVNFETYLRERRPAQPEPHERDPRLPAIYLTERDTEWFGRWVEGTLDGCRVAFQSETCGKSVIIFAGDFDPDVEQLSETYLGQVGPGVHLPADGSDQRIAVAIGPEGHALDDRFLLYATGGDYAQLKLRAVRDALLGLSESVREVMLFETRGVELIADATASVGTVRDDTQVAIRLHRALGAHPRGRVGIVN